MTVICLTWLYLQRAKSEEYQKETTEGQGFNACDTYAMAAAINDTLITEMEEVRSWPLHVRQAFRPKSQSNMFCCFLTRLQ